MQTHTTQLNDEEALDQLREHDANIHELYRLYRGYMTPLEAVRTILCDAANHARKLEAAGVPDEGE